MLLGAMASPLWTSEPLQENDRIADALKFLQEVVLPPDFLKFLRFGKRVESGMFWGESPWEIRIPENPLTWFVDGIPLPTPLNALRVMRLMWRVPRCIFLNTPDGGWGRPAYCGEKWDEAKHGEEPLCYYVFDPTK